MKPNQWIPIAVLLINIPLFLWIGRLMFGTWFGFWQSFRWNSIPDWFSLFRGKLGSDMQGEWKSAIYVYICLGIFLLQIIVISNLR